MEFVLPLLLCAPAKKKPSVAATPAFFGWITTGFANILGSAVFFLPRERDRARALCSLHVPAVNIFSELFLTLVPCGADPSTLQPTNAARPSHLFPVLFFTAWSLLSHCSASPCLGAARPTPPG